MDGKYQKKKMLAILKSIKVRPTAKFSKISGHRGSHEPKKTTDRGGGLTELNSYFVEFYFLWDTIKMTGFSYKISKKWEY